MGIDSPIHLLFLGAVALIVLGPKRLPELARALGKGIREFRTAFDEAAAPQSGPAPAPALQSPPAPSAAAQSAPAPAPQSPPAPSAAPQVVTTPVLEREQTTVQLAAAPITSPAVAQQTGAEGTGARQAGAEQAGPVPHGPPETGPERPS
jgi:sec-independent protein translocase protein TatB